jgi:hypothetical protein
MDYCLLGLHGGFCYVLMSNIEGTDITLTRMERVIMPQVRHDPNGLWYKTKKS